MRAIPVSVGLVAVAGFGRHGRRARKARRVAGARRTGASGPEPLAEQPAPYPAPPPPTFPPPPAYPLTGIRATPAAPRAPTAGKTAATAASAACTWASRSGSASGTGGMRYAGGRRVSAYFLVTGVAPGVDASVAGRRRRAHHSTSPAPCAWCRSAAAATHSSHRRAGRLFISEHADAWAAEQGAAVVIARRQHRLQLLLRGARFWPSGTARISPAAAPEPSASG